jgi:esterase/lipase superfamily enzyme
LKESGSEAFLFIHGYNVEFDDAVLRTAQLFRDLEFNGVPILFSWPAQNAWWRYPAAEDAVGDSSRKLEEFISELLSRQKLTAVNVVAHSMGNRVLEGALDRLTLRKVNPGFKNVVMAAPDINIADLDNVSAILRASTAHATVYASSKDVALLASKAFHSYPRLGEAPPPRVAKGIDTVDASAIRQDLLGHSYFADSGTVIRDLFLLLKQGLGPQARFLDQSAGAPRYWVIPK